MRRISITKRSALGVSFAFLALAFSRAAMAGPSAPPVPMLTGAGTTTANNSGFTLGFQITVGNDPIQLNSLGVWDEGSDGLSASHPVGIWNDSGTSLLGQVTVPSGTGSTLVDGYRFVDFSTPLQLAANTTYTLGAAYNSDDVARDITGFSYASRNTFASPDITIDTGGFEIGSTLKYPSGGLSTIYNGPNGLFVVVPEPASIALLLLIASVCRRRRAH